MKFSLAVLGRPIAHSLTPRLMAGISRVFWDEVTCPRIDCGEAELEATVARLRAEGVAGFNCTMPLKTEMSRLCATRTDEARILRSVNTVLVTQDGFSGTTTDGEGMVRSVLGAGGMIAGESVLLLGAGGAARSIALSLCRAGARQLTVLNRTPEGGDALAEMLAHAGVSTAVRVAPLTAEALAAHAVDAALCVNATSCGMSGCPPLPDLGFLTRLPRGAAVADAVYQPRETALLAGARGAGLITVPGLLMLIWQGVLAYGFFTGRDPAAVDPVPLLADLCRDEAEKR